MPTTSPSTLLPVSLLLLGCMSLAASAVLISWAGADAGTTSVVRCLLAAVILAPLARREMRRNGAPPRRFFVGAALAGALLGLDLCSPPKVS
ncbi:MAG: hypothetical protein WBG36_05515 [Ornithinimicrobium sp.]